MANAQIRKFAWATVFVGLLGSGLGAAAYRLPPGASTSIQGKNGSPQTGQAPSLDSRGDPLPPGAFLRLGTQRLRHGGAVISVLWSPDGKWIGSCAGDFDNCVHFWDPETGREKLLFKQHKTSVIHFGISPDAKLAASVDNQGSFFLWEADTGKVLRNRRLDRNSPLVFSPDGKTFTAIDENGQACVVDAATLQTTRVFSPGRGLPPATVLTWSQDFKLLATADTFHKVRLFDSFTSKVLHVLDHTSRVVCVSFAPDGKTMATAGDDKNIHLWDTASGQRKGRLEGHQSAVLAVVWSADGKTLASGSDDNTIRHWDLSNGRQLRKIDCPDVRVQCLALSPNGKQLASAGMGSEDRIRIWELDTGKQLLTDEDHTGWLASVAVLDGGKTILTSASDDKLRFWDVQTGKCTGQLMVPRWRAKGISITRDGKLLAAGGGDGTIRLLELPSGKLVKQFKADNEGINCVAFSPDDKWLVSNSGSKKTWLWDVASGEIIRELKHWPDNVSSLAFSPDGKTLCIGAGNKGILYIWDPIADREKGRITVHKREIVEMAFTPDGKFLVSVSKDASARIWDLTTGREARVLKWTSFGASMAISPDGRMVATGQGSRVIRLWELATGKQRAAFEGHRGAVAALAFLPDGNSLVSGSADSTGLCWDFTGLGRTSATPPQRLSLEQVEVEWQFLRSEDAVRAYRALLTLSANPDQVLPKLQKELQPTRRFDPEEIARWVADLDDNKFAVRAKAAAELKKAGDVAWPALLKVFNNPPSLEMQERIRALIGNQDDVLLPVPERLLVVRALELLERLGSPEARVLVRSLSNGAPDAWLTKEAKEMLKRMP